MAQPYAPSSTLKQRYRGLGCEGDRLQARERHAWGGDIYRDEVKRVRDTHTHVEDRLRGERDAPAVGL